MKKWRYFFLLVLRHPYQLSKSLFEECKFKVMNKQIYIIYCTSTIQWHHTICFLQWHSKIEIVANSSAPTQTVPNYNLSQPTNIYKGRDSIVSRYKAVLHVNKSKDMPYNPNENLCVYHEEDRGNYTHMKWTGSYLMTGWYLTPGPHFIGFKGVLELWPYLYRNPKKFVLLNYLIATLNIRAAPVACIKLLSHYVDPDNPSAFNEYTTVSAVVVSIS